MGWFSKKSPEPRRRRKKVMPPLAPNSLQVRRDDFAQEVRATAERYTWEPMADFKLVSDHGRVMPFHELWPATFDQWMELDSWADRRTILYEVLDPHLAGDLPSWLVAERLLDDCQAEEARRTLAVERGPPDTEAHEWWATVSKCYSAFLMYEHSLDAAKRAVALAPNHKRARIQLGEALIYMDDTDRGLEILRSLWREHAQPSEHRQNTYDLDEAFGFPHGALPSPLWALAIVKSQEDVDPSMWSFLVEEYPGDPEIRCNHAHWLMDQGERLEACLAFFQLAYVMPWHRVATLYACVLFRTLDPRGEIPEFQEHRADLEHRIESLGWSDESEALAELEQELRERNSDPAL